MSPLDLQQKEALKAAIQDGLPICSKPYQTLAKQLGLTEQQVMDQIRSWQQETYIKRMGLVVRHHSLGYCANAMVVWDIPDHLVDEMGAKLSESEYVNLCYQRKRQAPEWQYNLYCMIHGKNKAQVHEQIQNLIEQANLTPYSYAILFSNQQFKQTGGHYARQAG